MTAETFEYRAGLAMHYSIYITFTAATALGLFSFIFVIATKRYNNVILMCLCICIIGDGVTFDIMEYYNYHLNRNGLQWALPINTIFDSSAHMMICIAYRKVIIEMEGLFDKDIHLNNPEKISRIKQQKVHL